MTAELYMVRLVLDRRAVLRVGARHRLGQAVDDGALLHAGLSQLFAKNAARVKLPFHSFTVDDTMAASLRQPDLLFLLAYTSMNEAELTAAMGPARTELMRRYETRKMPLLEANQHLGFRTRVCPVTRTRSRGAQAATPDQRGRARHRELDAFVHATLAVPPEMRLERDIVYGQWLERQLQKNSACSVRDVRMAEFGLDTMRRRGNARLVRPNVVLEGTLSITDPAVFQRLLARGVGRHRAFGFGMLLLRPLTC